MVCFTLLLACWALSYRNGVEFADICDAPMDADVMQALCRAIAI